MLDPMPNEVVVVVVIGIGQISVAYQRRTKL